MRLGNVLGFNLMYRTENHLEQKCSEATKIKQHPLKGRHFHLLLQIASNVPYKEGSS